MEHLFLELGKNIKNFRRYVKFNIFAVGKLANWDIGPYANLVEKGYNGENCNKGEFSMRMAWEWRENGVSLVWERLYEYGKDSELSTAKIAKMAISEFRMEK